MKISCKSSITASKLFRSSTRQAAILAALEDPINVELVTQLDEYIGDEYKDLLNPADEPEVNPVDDVDTEPTEDNDMPDRPIGNKVAKFTPNTGGLSEKYEDDLAELDGEAPDMTGESAPEPKDTNSATKVFGRRIAADTATLTPDLNVHAGLIQLAGELKGTLNARSDTAGVTRVSAKNDEVWVYYSDDINLNNVMTAVLDLLNLSGYYYLLFNRLARTDNAIVFTLSTNDTDSDLYTAYGKEK